MVDFLAGRVGNDLKDSNLIHERQLFANWIKGTFDVHVETTWCFCSHLIEEQNKASLLHNALMEIQNPLADVGSANKAVERVEKGYRTASPLSTPAAQLP